VLLVHLQCSYRLPVDSVQVRVIALDFDRVVSLTLNLLGLNVIGVALDFGLA
jgi:hypothetical protein